MVIEGVASWWELMLSGVFQGSVSGPVPFIVFIDDIHLHPLIRGWR